MLNERENNFSSLTAGGIVVKSLLESLLVFLTFYWNDFVFAPKTNFSKRYFQKSHFSHCNFL